MLNEILKGQLEVLSSNELMIQAIRELFLERIDKEKPTIELTNNDKILGEKYRAYEQSKKVLDGFMVDISSYDRKKTNKDSFNKGK